MPSRDLSTIKFCEVCKKKFHPFKGRPGLFCSGSCQRKGRKMRPTVFFEGKCECCGKEFKRPKYNTDKTTRFCSIQCMANIRGQNLSGINHPLWSGGSSRTGSGTICRRIKKEIGKCQKCDCEENLHAHHKIPVSERPELAAIPENIEILCDICHAKEHPEFKGMLLKKRSGMYMKCEICSKEFYVKKSKLTKRKYCSRECSLIITSIGLKK